MAKVERVIQSHEDKLKAAWETANARTKRSRGLKYIVLQSNQVQKANKIVHQLRVDAMGLPLLRVVCDTPMSGRPSSASEFMKNGSWVPAKKPTAVPKEVDTEKPTPKKQKDE